MYIIMNMEANEFHNWVVFPKMLAKFDDMICH